MTLAYRDSSFDRPTAAQAAAAWAAGVRVWGGYIAAVVPPGPRPGGSNLATSWTQADFAVLQAAGIACVGYCSGWDDATACGALARAWGVIPVLDLEDAIRGDGPWVDAWLAASGAGLYGLCAVHWRAAPWHIVARYPGVPVDASSWDPLCPRPVGLLGWQAEGTHTDPATGLQVDGGWLDDGFTGGPTMTLTPDDLAAITKIVSDQDFPVRQDIVDIEGRIIAAVTAARADILAALATAGAPSLNHTHKLPGGSTGTGEPAGA